MRIGLAVLLTTGTVAMQPAPASAATRWKVQASPSTRQFHSSLLSDVACATATSCFAVGSTTAGAGNAALIERWNGSKWTVVDAPVPPAASSSALSAIACADSTHCVAVGTYRTDTTRGLAAHWNGSTWSLRAIPKALTLGIACPSPTACFAIGNRFTPSGTKPGFARWNGTTWSEVAGPGLSGQAYVRDITCTSASHCVAIGFHYTDGAYIAQWNGASWSTVSHALTGVLSGVTCRSTTQCFAVGDSESGTPHAAVWNGTIWSEVPADEGDNGFSGLLAVECAGATECFAVGVQRGTGPLLVERWNGSAFTRVSAPAPGGVGDAALRGIACPSSTRCVAVGAVGQPGGRTIGATWNGTTWSATPTVDPAPPGSRLHALTCRSAGECVGVGTSAPETALIERWNGSKWSLQAAPRMPSGDGRRLHGVACPTVKRCFAVGGQHDNLNEQQRTLIERWDGTRWTALPGATDPLAPNTELYDVTCATSTRCFAVGYSDGRGGPSKAIRVWNGRRWADSPSPQRNFETLYDVTCPRPALCFAVGREFPDGVDPIPLIERRSGGKWTAMNILAPYPDSGELLGAACTGPKNCIAVGRSFSESGDWRRGPSRAFAERWDGTRWRIIPVPHPSGAASSALSAVACRNAVECIAVGELEVDGIVRPLTQRWDGSRWTRESTPSPSGARSTTLSDIACPSASVCIAVGSVIERNAERTFVVRRSS
jgi:hypothetical protein